MISKVFIISTVTLAITIGVIVFVYTVITYSVAPIVGLPFATMPTQLATQLNDHIRYFLTLISNIDR